MSVTVEVNFPNAPQQTHTFEVIPRASEFIAVPASSGWEFWNVASVTHYVAGSDFQASIQVVPSRLGP